MSVVNLMIKAFPNIVPEYYARHLIDRYIYWNRKNSGIKYYFSRKLLLIFNISIGKNAQIGNGVSFPHPQNIIIGDNVVIEDNCVIYHNTTFGIDAIGKGQYPRIEKNCVIYCGAMILGDVVVGHDSIIAAGAVVTKSVDCNTLAGGVPARTIKKL